MEYCELAPGFKVSRVLTGLWQIADMERDNQSIDLDQTAKSMVPYVEAGLTSFDMADHYGSSEIISGIYSESYNKNGVQFLTKWVPEPGPISRDDVREAVQRSLDRMKASRIDLLQYHAWNYSDPSWLDGLFYLQELKEEGLVRNLGLTNFDTPHLRMVIKSGIRIASNQVCYSMLDQRAAGEMSRLCVNYGVKLLSFGTIAGGFLTEKWLGKSEPNQEELSTWSQMKYKRFIDSAGGWKNFQLLLKTLKEIADKYEVSVANVATKYILEQPAVGGIIIGARLGKSEHIHENLRLFQFKIEESDMARIKEAMQMLDPIPGDCGDEYRKPPYLTASGDLSHHIDEMPAPYEVTKLPNGRTRVLSGVSWEKMYGYSRAIRKGNKIYISGTTATHRDRIIGGYDPKAQTHFVIDKIEGALQSLGSKLEDVVRTRVYVQDLDDWERVARVHGQRFREILPANTLVQAELVGDGYLVEIEVEAEVD